MHSKLNLALALLRPTTQEPARYGRSREPHVSYVQACLSVLHVLRLIVLRLLFCNLRLIYSKKKKSKLS